MSVRLLVTAARASTLAAMPGDRFFSSNVPHDSCSMMVIYVNDAVGVQARAAFSLPDGRPMTSERFFPARR